MLGGVFQSDDGLSFFAASQRFGALRTASPSEVGTKADRPAGLGITGVVPASDSDLSAGPAATASGDGVPSSERPGSTPKASTNKAALATALNVRIARLLGGGARMSHGPVQGIANLLGVFPDVA